GAPAARQGDEAIGKIIHEPLTLVHGIDFIEPGETPVSHFFLKKGAGNHPEHLALFGKHGVGDHAHEAHLAASEDEPHLLPGQSLGEGARRLPIAEKIPTVGAKKDTDLFHWKAPAFNLKWPHRK